MRDVRITNTGTGYRTSAPRLLQQKRPPEGGLSVFAEKKAGIT
jgi:hypothetical protein